jgi:NitT/TauT family transport system substrate-binding protein
MKKIIMLSAVILTVLVVVTGCSLSQEEVNQEAVPIKIGYRAQVFYSPLFVGMEKGYFANHNLEVEPVEFTSTNQLMEALLAGRIDAALGGVNTFILFSIEEKSKGEFNVFTLAHETADNPLIFMLAKNDSDVKSVQDLNNRVIGSHPGSAVQIMYEKFVKVNDLEGTSLMQMKPSLLLQSLEAGQIDAMIAIEPLPTVGAQKGISKVIDKAIFDKYFVENIPIASSVVSTRFVAEQNQAAKNLVAATAEATDFIEQNPDETKQIITKYTPLEESITKEINLPDFEMVDREKDLEVEKLIELLHVLDDSSQLNVKNMFWANK